MAATFILTLAGSSPAQNLISDPHFDAGTNSFQSDYQHSPAALNQQGTFAVSNNPAALNLFFVSFFDHTSTNGLMLIVNGEVNPPVPTNAVWRQTLSVQTHRQYRFAVWMANACCTSGGNPGQIALVINGADLSGPLPAPSQAGKWVEHSIVWDSGEASSATLEVRIPTTFGSGNDFALDDFSFTKVGVSRHPISTLHRAVEIRWPSVSNEFYQIQWAARVDTNTWHDFGTPIPGNGSTSSVFDSAETSAQRYYRVLLVE